jgi:hypothetical protein
MLREEGKISLRSVPRAVEFSGGFFCASVFAFFTGKRAVFRSNETAKKLFTLRRAGERADK